MELDVRVYIGWDKKNFMAYEVCARSILKHANTDVEIIPLHEWKLRHNKKYWRSYLLDESGQMVDRADRSKFSTDFSFTRFLIPALEEYRDEWVLYIDSDMLFRANISELFACIDHSKAVMCVKHQHQPFESSKMYGLKQTYYQRKNWSSLMLFNPSKCTGLTLYAVNNWSGESLHGMQWIDEALIGELPIEWNYLVGYTDPSTVLDPKLVHFTLGTPDMPGCSNVEYAEEWKKEAKSILLFGADYASCKVIES